MALRRGFKTEASWYAREMRRELGLSPQSPLCPWQLADHLGFPIFALSEYQQVASEAVAYFHSNAGRRTFSAITLFDDRARFIVHNDYHHPKRQAANISHELAHGLLLHPPKPPFDATGSRHYNKEIEEEANWLGPTLLVSDEAALFIAERNMSIAEASDRYSVSSDIIQMRLNVSGARIRIARRRVA